MPEAPEAVWVGLDLGTQGARAVALSETGAPLGSGSAPLRGRRDGPVHEQDPGSWWPAVATATRAALAGVPAGAVRGVACCSTSGTVLLAAEDGRPLTPALMHDDARAAPAPVARVDGGWPHRPQPSWALAKLLWLAERGHTGHVLHQADVVTRTLTGEPVATDSSHALKTGYDLHAERWPDAVTSALAGLELPAVVRPGSPLGAVCEAAAAETGLPAGIPVIAGMTDSCAAQIGAGALRAGSWSSVLGTTLALRGVAERPLHDPDGVVYSHRSPDGDWLPGGASGAGAGALEEQFGGRDLRRLDAAAAEREPAPVVIFPLVGRGERFPFSAPGAERFVLGEPRDELDRYAGLLQGVALVERLCLERLARLGARVEGPLTVSGGGARSDVWCRLRADVLGRPLRRPRDGSAAAGMAMLAAAATERAGVAATAAAMTGPAEEFAPRAGRPERFEAPYARLKAELRARGWL